MTTLEDKVVELADKAEVAVNALAHKIADLASQHGEAAWELAKAVARIDAGQGLFKGGIALAVAVAFFFVGKVLFKKGQEVSGNRHGDGLEWFCPSVIAFVGAGIAGAVSAVCLSNLWAWTGLFYPEIWMAHKVLESAF